MKYKIEHFDMGEHLMYKFHIVKNKKGVYFDKYTEKVINLSELECYMRSLYPEYKRLYVKEVFSYIDVMCEKTKLTSSYYRKSYDCYGIQCGWTGMSGG